MIRTPRNGPFDEPLMSRRMARLAAPESAPMPDFLHRHALQELTLRLAAINRHFARAVICTAAPADASRIVESSGKVEEIRHVKPWSMSGEHDDPAAAVILPPQALAVAPQSIDLFISILDLALVNDLPGALSSIRRALRPDGLFLAVLPGENTLHELRAAWAMADSARFGEPQLRVAPFCSLQQVGSLMQMARFALPVIDLERLTVRYPDALALISELKALGWANPLAARPRRPVTRGLVAHAAALYETAHADADGRIPATFELLSLSGWAPHESQQKPLKPGTACMPLGKALSGGDMVPPEPVNPRRDPS